MAIKNMREGHAPAQQADRSTSHRISANGFSKHAFFSHGSRARGEQTKTALCEKYGKIYIWEGVCLCVVGGSTLPGKVGIAYTTKVYEIRAKPILFRNIPNAMNFGFFPSVHKRQEIDIRLPKLLAFSATKIMPIDF